MPNRNPKISTLDTLFSIVFSFLLFFLLLNIIPKIPLKAQQVQGTPPVIVDFEYSKDTFTTTDVATDTVTIYLRMSDVTGVEGVSGTIRPTKLDQVSEYGDISNPQEISIQAFEYMDGGDCSGLSETFTSGLTGCGTIYDGIWKADVEFPVRSAAGDWLLGKLSGSNLLGVYVDFDPLADLFPLKEVTIENLGTDYEDTAGPVVSGYVITPESIDSALDDVSITMYIRLTDLLSGVTSDAQNPWFYWEDGDEKNISMTLQLVTDESVCTNDVPSALKDGLEGCGDLYDGIFMGTSTLPRYSPSGLWEITQGFGDSMGNQTADLDSLPYFENIAATYDVIPPVLKSLTLSPSSFDSSSGPVDITLTIGIEDNFSGVKTADVSLNPLISPNSQSTEKKSFALKDGETDVYELVVTVPQDAKLGFWAVNQVDITDNAGNVFAIGFKELSILFPDLDLFLANSKMADEVLIEEEWYIEEWDDSGTNPLLTHPEMNIKFQEGTVVTKLEGGTFAFHRMLTRKYDLETYNDLGTLITEANSQLATDLQSCDISEGCVNTPLNTSNLVGTPIQMLKMGIPGLNLSFSKPVTITLAVDEEYLGQTFVIQTFNILTNSWSNDTSCTVAVVQPESFEQGGNESIWFAPAPYPACRFTTDHATFFSANVLGVQTEELETEELPGVPKTGYGGSTKSLIERYLEW